MNKIKINSILCFCILLGIIFIALLTVKDSTLISRISLAFTAIASIATVATLIIAIKLYDEYGLKNYFINKQVEKVFDLVSLLKGKTFLARAGDYNYMIRHNSEQLDSFNEQIEQYSRDKYKHVLISLKNYKIYADSFLEIKRSHWLPESIRAQMKYIEIYGTISGDFPLSEFVILSFENVVDSSDLVQIVPSMTLENFVSSTKLLTLAIETWLTTHSPIKLDLRFEEKI